MTDPVTNLADVRAVLGALVARKLIRDASAYAWASPAVREQLRRARAEYEQLLDLGRQADTAEAAALERSFFDRAASDLLNAVRSPKPPNGAV